MSEHIPWTATRDAVLTAFLDHALPTLYDLHTGAAGIPDRGEGAFFAVLEAEEQPFRGTVGRCLGLERRDGEGVVLSDTTTSVYSLAPDECGRRAAVETALRATLSDPSVRAFLVNVWRDAVTWELTAEAAEDNLFHTGQVQWMSRFADALTERRDPFGVGALTGCGRRPTKPYRWTAKSRLLAFMYVYSVLGTETDTVFTTGEAAEAYARAHQPASRLRPLQIGQRWFATDKILARAYHRDAGVDADGACPG